MNELTKVREQKSEAKISSHSIQARQRTADKEKENGSEGEMEEGERKREMRSKKDTRLMREERSISKQTCERARRQREQHLFSAISECTHASCTIIRYPTDRWC